MSRGARRVIRELRKRQGQCRGCAHTEGLRGLAGSFPFPAKCDLDDKPKGAPRRWPTIFPTEGCKDWDARPPSPPGDTP